MPDCGCTPSVTVNCANTTGCVSTNYAKCIYYSGTGITCSSTNIVSNGDTVDEALEALGQAICGLTPADLDWASFDYDCYASENWATAQEFAEGITAKLCAIDSGGGLLPATTSIPASATTAVAALTPGTSTLEETYEAVFTDLKDFKTFNTTGSVTQGCFTTAYSATSLRGAIQWVRNNVCTIKTALEATDTALDGRLTDIEDYVGSSNLIDNTDCLGGTSTDTLSDTIGYIKTLICSHDTSISALPNFSALSLGWNTCVGMYPAYGNTASLTTHLTRLLNEISKRTITFDSGDFTVSSGSCGTTVALATSGIAFTCSDLASCSIHNIGDVNSTTLGTGSGDKFKVLSWSIVDSEWKSKPLSLTSSGGTAAITSTDSGTALTYNVEVNLSDGGVTADATISTPIDIVLGTPSAGTTSIALKYDSDIIGDASTGTLTVSSGVASSSIFIGNLTMKLANGVIYLAGHYDMTLVSNWTNNSAKPFGTLPSALRPSQDTWILGYFNDYGTNVSVPIIIQIISSTGLISVINSSGATITSGSTGLVSLNGLSIIK